MEQSGPPLDRDQIKERSVRSLICGPAFNYPTYLRPTLISLCSIAIAASFVCVWARWRLYRYDDMPWSEVLHSIGNAYYDVWLIVVALIGATAIAFMFRRSQLAVKAIVGLFWAFCLALVVLGAINISAITFLGGPLSFQWLYYADFLATFTSRSSVATALNASFFVNLLGSAIGLLLLAIVASRLLRIAERAQLLGPVLAVGILAVAAFLWFTSDRRHFGERDRARALNPLVELVRTTFHAGSTDLLAQANGILPPVLPPAKSDSQRLPAGLAEAGIRNALVIVMESVGANSVAGTGPVEAKQWTPNIARYSDRSLAFRNVYAHVAYSTKSLFALLTSRYPRFTYRLETNDFDGAQLPTLASELHKSGYRTAFFMSGELAFQSVDRFVDRTGFDQRTDMTGLHCGGQRYVGSSADWVNMDSVDDGCTADAVLDWIENSGEQPFFGIFWTGNTHWPYFSDNPPPPDRWSQNHHRNRYVGALRSSDAAIGSILDRLAKDGRLSDTLVVVLGDHGEAFGEHGFLVHSNSIFEEEVHIPLLMINDNIDGESFETLGGIIDIGPTIFDILGRQPPAGWQGRSLFDTHRSPRVHMFSINQDMITGYREGNHKYIYKLSTDRAQIFDLASDPGETKDISTPTSRELIRRYSAGWLRQQKALDAPHLRSGQGRGPMGNAVAKQERR